MLKTMNCKRCEIEFTYGLYKSTLPRQFCSIECNRKFRKPLPLMNCEICNKEFHYKLTINRQRKACSRKCAVISNSINCKGVSRSSTNCIRCNIEFSYKVDPKLSRKYCTRLCKDLHLRTRIEDNCLSCGKVISKTPSRMSLYCSIKCRDVERSKNHPFAFYKKATEEEKLNKLKELYERHVIKQDGCWDWTAFKDKLGYGQLTFDRKVISIHRASWIIHNGEIPKGLWVLHHCDNPSCSRPDHTYLGNAQDNRRDCVSRNRANIPIGEKHPGAKLKVEQIIEIKKLIKEGKLLHREIAEKFNINKGAISQIKTNKIWRHIL